MPANRESGVTTKSDRVGSNQIDTKRVSDVIGHPESWRNYLRVDGEGPTDFRGATISEVIVVGTEVAVSTTGGPCGATLSFFTIVDENLRNRVAQALRPGLNVYRAAADEI
jgi:hypothetical protein